MQNRFEYKPFTFKDFSAPEPEVSPADAFVPAFPSAVTDVESIPSELQIEELAPEPAISEEELAAIRQEAYEQGRSDGRREAEAMLDAGAQQQRQELHSVFTAMMTRLDAELATAEQAAQQQRKEVGTLVLLLARKLAGNALTAQPLGAVEPMISECLNMLVGENTLHIAVTPSVVEPLKAYLAEHRRTGQELVVDADPKLQVGDCRILWPSGKAERNHEAVWREIEKIVTRSMEPPVSQED